MLKLMIVDDEQIIREALSEMIDYRSLGYELAATAKNGMEAYDILCDEEIDVVITDIQMPILNGLDFIARACKTDSDISFILLSGYSDFAYARQAMQYGVRHYLLKPTDKQELIDTLGLIRDERDRQQADRLEEQNKLLARFRLPLEQSFLMEALERQERFDSIFVKYRTLLGFSEEASTACICNFVEPHYLTTFAQDIYGLLSHFPKKPAFPLIYVKNTAILLPVGLSLTQLEELRNGIEGLSYPSQAVSFTVSFLHENGPRKLLEQVIMRISRFEQITLLDEEQNSQVVKNHVATPWRVELLGKNLARAADSVEIQEILHQAVQDGLSLETSRSLALSLFLDRTSRGEGFSPESAYDFFRKLYCCDSPAAIRDLLFSLPFAVSEEQAIRPSGNIALLKAYVEQHLDSENLSLKWLAEHYLFVSTGYLSKQFVREEGIRFSDYLNRRRMEEAGRLMEYYRKDNIKQIAQQVGFGANPQYFSQVFKKYMGVSPSEYMERLNP